MPTEIPAGHHIEYRHRPDGSIEGICINCLIAFSSYPVPSTYQDIRRAQNWIAAQFWPICAGDRTIIPTYIGGEILDAD